MPTLTFKKDLQGWLKSCLATFEAEFGPGQIVVEVTEDLEVVAVITPAPSE